jgi:hypothetical protein
LEPLRFLPCADQYLLGVRCDLSVCLYIPNSMHTNEVKLCGVGHGE